jgi:DNA topoisomerase-2
MKITEFFDDEYVDFSSYDNIRKIASLVDGQKNASRKILYTVLEKNIKNKIKVSQLGSKVAEFSEYLHGNLDGVIVNLSRDFLGTNNIPLLQKNGNFGTRFSPEASASRYIYTYGTAQFFELFKKDDSPILNRQFFEGEEIEPMFYVPSLPMLLINGSEGVSSGFAQKILPRDPKKLKQYIDKVLGGKNYNPSFKPFYKGFRGIVIQGEHSAQWLIKGVVKRKGINKVQITEVPVGYDLKGYIKILDTLEDKKIIQSYRDKSENDNFLFDVNIASKFLKEWSDDELLIKLKLVKKITENYTVLDENNKIQVYTSIKEILDKYISVKLKFIAKRKEYLITKFEMDIRLNFSKYTFIKMIVDDELKVNKRKKIDIVLDIDKIDKIIKKDNSYDYLLNMNILSLTKERMNNLENDIKQSKEELDLLKGTSINDIWLSELLKFM